MENTQLSEVFASLIKRLSAAVPMKCTPSQCKHVAETVISEFKSLGLTEYEMIQVAELDLNNMGIDTTQTK